jgi:hypothetical protein
MGLQMGEGIFNIMKKLSARGAQTRIAQPIASAFSAAAEKYSLKLVKLPYP